MALMFPFISCSWPAMKYLITILLYYNSKTFQQTEQSSLSCLKCVLLFLFSGVTFFRVVCDVSSYCVTLCIGRPLAIYRSHAIRVTSTLPGCVRTVYSLYIIKLVVFQQVLPPVVASFFFLAVAVESEAEGRQQTTNSETRSQRFRYV